MVEFAFDVDGRYFEGRADMNVQLDLEVESSLSHHDFRERILFAWACLCYQHLLLKAKAVSSETLSGQDGRSSGSDVCFVIEAATNISQAIEDSAKRLVFLNDHFEAIDPLDFWTHCQNTARIIDPSTALAKLFILPLELVKNGHSALRFLIVGAHEILDGLTMYTWSRDLVHFLNKPLEELRQELRDLMEPSKIVSRLPLPQEALYPPINGNRAQRRWFWLLTRILRHVRKPLSAGFVNPLRRTRARTAAVSLSSVYSPFLDYSRAPLLNCLPLSGRTSPKATQRLHRLCREANASIGAGSFALAALIMMEMYERREPDVPPAERRPFISGFPLDPRAFFDHRTEPNSLMLAFCDGIALPFLPSDLDLDGRIRLLARQAHRQLAAYQKRSNVKQDDAGLQYMSSRGAGRMLANQYILGIERMDSKLPPHLRKGLNPQGAYPMRPNRTMQTCGVSSVGRRDAVIKQGIYDLDDDTKDFVVDYRGVHASVRPRDGEFLVGCGGSDDGLWVNASIDGNAMDPALVAQWRMRFETVLEEDKCPLSKL